MTTIVKRLNVFAHLCRHKARHELCGKRVSEAVEEIERLTAENERQHSQLIQAREDYSALTAEHSVLVKAARKQLAMLDEIDPTAKCLDLIKALNALND